MRVLFTGHLPFEAWPLGSWLSQLGEALVRAGHEVQGLVASGEPVGDDSFPVSRVLCRDADASADLHFPPPCFAEEGGSVQTFESLSDLQIREYREAWRRRLDREVDSFNPHVIHAGHLWWDAHLALETGVPYVASAWNAELTCRADRPALRAHVEQAAENASRVFVPHRAMGAAVQAAFGIGPDHIAPLTPAVDLHFRPTRPKKPSEKHVLDRLGLPPDRGPLVVARVAGSPEGGADVLLNAAARYQAVVSAHAPFGQPLTVIATTAAIDPEWARLAERLGLDRVRMVQLCHAADWLTLWQAADLAVFPDTRPADGLDVLWALAAGTPAIVTETAGLEWLAGCPAVGTIASGDHELLADAVLEGLARNWKTTDAKAAIEFVRRHHSIDEAARHVAESYRSVLNQRFGQMPRD